jgi:DNA-binding beta-propeller fold protein YncE
MHQLRFIGILLTALLFCCSGLVKAEIERGDSRSFKLDAKPIDMTITADGKYIFVLAEGGRVLSYDNTSGELKGTINVSESAMSIATSSSGDFLLLADSKSNTLEMVGISFVEEIDIAGLPFKGPADAPVVIAVFSDYQ